MQRHRAGEFEFSSPNVIDCIYRWDSGDLAASTHFNYVQPIGRIPIPRSFDGVHRAERDRFVRAVRGETAPESPAGSAIYPTLLMQARRESSERGAGVCVRDIATRCGLRC